MACMVLYYIITGIQTDIAYIGLENNLWQDSTQTQLASNISLVKRVHRFTQEFERPIMKSEIFGNKGFTTIQYETKKLMKI